MPSLINIFFNFLIWLYSGWKAVLIKTKGTYKVKHDIYNLDGDIVINIDESVEFNGEVDTIMGYDVFKYNDVYLTTEDLYA